MKVTLKDSSVKEYDQSLTVLDVARDISEGLARVAVAGEVDGEVVDLRTELDKDCSLQILTANDPEGLRVVRHTVSHVMAEAVKRLFPNAKLAIGPAIDEGSGRHRKRDEEDHQGGEETESLYHAKG